jgi:CRP-like cAMP-binding protein
MLGTRSVVERLALVLLNLADHRQFDLGDAVLVTRAVSHEELAALVGATRQWISMTLERFRKRGLLATRNRRIIILQPAELRAISVSQ